MSFDVPKIVYPPIAAPVSYVQEPPMSPEFTHTTISTYAFVDRCPWRQEAVQLSRELIHVSDQVRRLYSQVQRLQERLSRLSSSCEVIEVAKDRAETRARECEQALQAKKSELRATDQHVEELRIALHQANETTGMQQSYIDKLHKDIHKLTQHNECGMLRRNVTHRQFTPPALM